MNLNLTSSVCKLMERIVKDELEVHLERNGLIGTSQHGFRRGRSPVTNLIEFMEKLTTWMEARPFDIVYCDFFEGIQQSMPQKLNCEAESGGSRRQSNRVDIGLAEGEEAEGVGGWRNFGGRKRGKLCSTRICIRRNILWCIH